jgi:hypothetical protein
VRANNDFNGGGSKIEKGLLEWSKCVSLRPTSSESLPPRNARQERTLISARVNTSYPVLLLWTNQLSRALTNV